MPEAVSSGLARTGPWLLNAWLRVETRLDAGSISPVALAGAFRPVERGLAFVEPADAPPLRFENANYDIQAHSDALGTGRRLDLTVRDGRRGVVLRREIVLYDAHPYCVTRVGVTNEGPRPLRIAALHAFATPPTARGRLKLTSSPADWRIYRNGWQSWSPAMSLGGAQRDLQSAPVMLAPEPPHHEPGRFASDDVAVLYDPASQRSLLAGAVSARDLLTQVQVDAPAKAIDARCLGDGVAIHPGETLWSERIAVDLCGTPNEQLERYGDALAREMGARVPPRTPSGWCSWYYFFTAVTEDDVVRNLRFLEQHRRELPVETVQIDDGYQADIGDWLSVNEKFPRGMQWLAAEIKRAGYTPGLWLAPFLLSEHSQTLAQHPDWIVRDAAGEPIVACDNWQRRSYALDGSHPDARVWLTTLFQEICDGWGYDYVKIDFLYAAAIAGRRHDPQATRIRAYRDALAAVRAGVGDRRFILGCGSLMAPSIGYFDGNRIGPDVAPFWRFLTTEERAKPRPGFRLPDDPLSAETAIRSTLTRSWMHNRLWANDPDCVLVRTDRTKLTLDETRTLATAIGLSAGMVLSSDDLDHVPPDRLDILSMLLPPLPSAARPLDLMQRDMPEQCEVVDERAFDPLRVVAVFNFDDDAKDAVLSLPEGRWHAFELWSERYLGVHEGQLTLTLLEPHGSRVIALRPATGAPTVVGTNAHIGCGLVDITHQEYDAAAGELRLALAPAGRRHRSLWIWTGEARPALVEADAASVAYEMVDRACRIDLRTDGGTRLTVRMK